VLRGVEETGTGSALAWASGGDSRPYLSMTLQATSANARVRATAKRRFSNAPALTTRIVGGIESHARSSSFPYTVAKVATKAAMTSDTLEPT